MPAKTTHELNVSETSHLFVSKKRPDKLKISIDDEHESLTENNHLFHSPEQDVPAIAVHTKTFSAPEPLNPRSNSFLSDPESSPAARFLSAFAPSATPILLPDSEGQVVSAYVLGPIIGLGGFSTIRR